MAFRRIRATVRSSVLREQRGSSMVEAAVVFPIVILVLFAMIMAMVFLFDETLAAASVRKSVIMQAGSMAGTAQLLQTEEASVPVITDIYRVKPCAAGERSVSFHTAMPGVRARSRTLSAHQYICNEKTQIRLWDLFE